MQSMSDDTLLETYIKAKMIGVDRDFIRLLEEELQRRKLFDDKLIGEIVRKYERK
jgi:hypothetical protein